MDRTRPRATLVVAGFAGAAAFVLSWAAPSLPAVSSGPELVRWLSRTPPADSAVTVAACVAWLCLAWLLLGVVLVLLSGLPGAAGRLPRVLARRLTPLLLRRAVEAALGATLTVAPVAAIAVPASAAPVAVAPAAGGTTSELAGGTAGEVAGSSAGKPATGTSPWPDLDRPTAAVAPTRPAARLRTPAPIPPRLRPARKAQVVVRAGDTLWDIARRSLPPGATAAEIAAEWPRWYTANRASIGADPDLLLPGQLLHPPH